MEQKGYRGFIQLAPTSLRLGCSSYHCCYIANGFLCLSWNPICIHSSMNYEITPFILWCFFVDSFLDFLSAWYYQKVVGLWCLVLVFTLLIGSWSFCYSNLFWFFVLVIFLLPVKWNFSLGKQVMTLQVSSKTLLGAHFWRISMSQWIFPFQAPLIFPFQ